MLAARGVDGEWVAWDDGAVDWSRFDAAWIRSTWNYTERHDAFVEWVARVDGLTALWNPAGVVRWNSHKSYLLDLAEEGVAVVPTVLVPAGQQLDVGALLEERGWDEAVVKPAVAVGAIGAARVERGQRQVVAATSGADRLVQPLVREVASGEVSIVVVDGRVTHAVRKIPAEGDFRVHREYGGREVVHQPTAAELDLATRALAAVGEPLLYARVDCVPTAEGPLLMELELIEPSLFLWLAPDTAGAALGDAVAGRLR